MSLVIKNLHANVQGTEILKGINLEIPKGEVHAIMGPNGSGKSTLSKVLCGHPDYEVTEGEAWLDGQNLLDMSIDERSRAGLFLAFQYPMEVPGVSNANFLRAAMQARMPHGRNWMRSPSTKRSMQKWTSSAWPANSRHAPLTKVSPGERKSAMKCCKCFSWIPSMPFWTKRIPAWT
ncbi:ABC transporter ATP-binding protein [Akkermansia muciniphila]|uniref:ABC transporter ATP-binding protein n=1 Tax=Akkermansia muciniphila TaxID=239935 RepID=UPI000F0B2656|nr:hypothetical protein CUB96_01375 [Akkermansia muciniphila]